jgi:hypothetical protein
MRHGILLVSCEVSGEAGGAAQEKLAGEFGNYAPEKKQVQGKIKKLKISLDKKVESGIHSPS